MAVLPYCRSGIVGGAMLGLGRAIGETIAVTILIGDAPELRPAPVRPGLQPGRGDRQRVRRGPGPAPLGAVRRRPGPVRADAARQRDRAPARAARRARPRAEAHRRAGSRRGRAARRSPGRPAAMSAREPVSSDRFSPLRAHARAPAARTGSRAGRSSRRTVARADPARC